MDIERIKAMLAEYYEGNTGREEEDLLKRFFTTEDVPPEMEADRMLFMSLANASSEGIPDKDFDEKVMAAIGENERKKFRPGKSRMLYMVSGIAASILLLAGSYLLLFDRQVQERITYDVYYTEQEMILAYEEAKNALIMVSSVMNTGTEELRPLTKISDATRELESMHRFHQGATELRALTLFEETVSGLRKSAIDSEIKSE
ncbi:MAG: hypothetical protein EA408_10540 [Marinilabiliales bacterium]|nr:MAG: hypothetical protein EA408_10540 [Marinilabiliales bacterium]